MDTIEIILRALDERNLAQRVGLRHDEARARFPLQRNTVDSFSEFERVIGEYYNHHFSHCVCPGARWPTGAARSKAKLAIESQLRRGEGDIVTAYNDAHDGTNGGMRVVLDTIAAALRAESLEDFIRDMFDTNVAPNSWDDKVEIIRQFIARCGIDLSASIRTDQPERYASDYRMLIQAYVDGLRRTSRTFRRL